MQREFFICAFQSSFLRLNDASMFQKCSCQVSKPSDVSGRIFFEKSDGRRRSKEDFLPRFMWWVQLLNLPRCYHGVPYQRSRHVRAFRIPVSPHSASFLHLSSTKFLDFSLCFLSFELLCLTMSYVAIRLFFQSEGAVVRANILSPVRGKSIVDSLWKCWSPRLNIGDRVHELPFPSRRTVMHTVIMSCQFTRNDSPTWLVELERR